ncbi:hypothetical protein ACXYRR_02630 [Mycoplasma sp. 246B]
MTFQTIIIIVLSTLLGFILIGVIIWRIWLKVNKKEDKNINNKIGYTSKATVDKLLILKNLTQSSVLTNILIKNSYAKKGFSILTGVVITQEKIFVISNIITSSNFEKIKIDSNRILLQANKKSKYKENFKMCWLNEINKWMNHKIKDFFEIIILIDENISSELIDNNSPYRTLNINSLSKEISQLSKKNLNAEKVVEMLLKRNLFKKSNNAI